MNLTPAVLILGLLIGWPLSASAQEGPKRHDKRAKREALLRKFDKDGDGTLSREERAAAREFKEKRRDERGALRKFREFHRGRGKSRERH